MLRTSLPPVFRSFHTSCVALASSRRQATSVIRKKNILKQAQRSKDAAADRPSVVLGTRPSEEAVKWVQCDLARILVDEEALFASASTTTTLETPIGTIHVPAQPAFGVSSPDQKLLFDHLPQLSAQAIVSSSSSAAIASAHGVSQGTGSGVNTPSKLLAAAEAAELEKANAFSKVVDLRNANAGGIAFENRRRIIEAFSTPLNPFDTGRSEVQAALKTYQIRKLWKHLTTYKRDVGNRLGLRKLVHQRAKILRYLRNTDRDRYEIVLERLALEPEAVEGELVV